MSETRTRRAAVVATAFLLLLGATTAAAATICRWRKGYADAQVLKQVRHHFDVSNEHEWDLRPPR